MQLVNCVSAYPTYLVNAYISVAILGTTSIAAPYQWNGRNDFLSLFFKKREVVIFSPEIITSCHIAYNLYSASAKRLGLRGIACHTLPLEVRACVRACVKRQRQRRQCCFSAASIWTHSLSKPYGPQHSPTTPGRLCNKQERERRLRRHTQPRSCDKHYPLEITHCPRILLVANRFSHFSSRHFGFLRRVVG
jgi:hypothetical protein